VTGAQKGREPALRYYEGADLIERVLVALGAQGLPTEGLDPDQLVGMDEFHALGRPATLALANLAEVQRGQRVLDVGAGIGGPSRVLAHHFGAEVTALDPTRRFCELNRVLSDRTRLARRVTVVEGDARDIPFADASFDLVWTQAVWQNIREKARVAEEIHRVLRPCGRFALFEIVAGPGGELSYPVPWANGPQHSFLVTPAEMRELLSGVGFVELVWNEGVDIQTSIQKAVTARLGMTTGASGLTLELVMPDFQARLASLARNVDARAVELVQAVLGRRQQSQP
jgi:SAM-dependent methyltransferase